MTFLQLRPYLKSGQTINKAFQYVSHWIGKGVKVDNFDITGINNQEPIKLKVMDSPEVTRELNKKKVKLYNTDGKSTYKYYYDGDAGYSFKVKCLISRNDKLPDDKTTYYYLNNFYTNNILVSVVINTEVVPNGVYAISDFTDITLVRNNYYEIEIEFTKHTQLSQKLTNKCTILQSKLKKCSYPGKQKVYTTKKINKSSAKDKKKMQVGKCLQYVNEILYTKGFYGEGASGNTVKKTVTKKNKKGKKVKTTKKVTLNRKYYYNTYKMYWSSLSKRALIKFQKKWNKQGLKPKLKTKGKLDKNTWAAIKKYTELK